jgi:hypothetical protein
MQFSSVSTLQEVLAINELLLDPIPPSGVQDDDKGLTLDELDELLLSSLIDSSFGPEEDESSPHPKNIIAAETIATRNFFINLPVIRYN